MKEGNLLVNDDKTDITVLKRDNKELEDWRHTKKLGTLLGDSEDIANRKRLATIAFCKMDRLWFSKNKRIKLKKKIQLYS